MMKPMKFATAAVVLAQMPLPAQAALSGFYDSGEQIRAILESPAVADAVRQQTIESLEHEGVRNDGAIRWEVETRDCDLIVHLRPVPPVGVGKTTYQVEVNDGCR